MRCSVSRGTACLPVNALHVIEHETGNFLLYNEGSSLVIRRAQSQNGCLSVSVFRSQNIHGITTRVVEKSGGSTAYSVVVWGGRLLCICILHISAQTETSSALSFTVKIINKASATDWIMTASCCQSEAYFLTAHNAVWKLSLAKSATQGLISVGQGVKTLLYSGAIVASRNDRLLIASGTVFGEVFVWTCSRTAAQWTVSQKSMFMGHQGSIYGIGLSSCFSLAGVNRRLLATCSDDRTIRIWDATGFDEDGQSSKDPSGNASGTGFSDSNDSHVPLAMAWAHLSRVWGVEFLEFGSPHSSAMHLLSRGEDGVCKVWRLDLDALLSSHRTKESLVPISQDRFHSGKNIWSVATCFQSQSAHIYTGGADGQIISRTMSVPFVTDQETVTFTNISEALKRKGETLKQCLVSPHGNITAIAGNGDVIASSTQAFGQWSVVSHSSGTGMTILCKNCTKGVGVFCLADGTLCAYDMLANTISMGIFRVQSQVSLLHVANDGCTLNGSTSKSLLVVFHGNQHALLVTISTDNAIPPIAQSINLPSDFPITSCYYNSMHGILVCGSRLGALAVFGPAHSVGEQFENSFITRHVHASDSITSIMEIPDTTLSQTALYLLTTGRDGTYAIHRLAFDDFERSGLETVHRAVPPFGPNIEGAYLMPVDEHNMSLLLYGFKSEDFIVWDETRQVQHMLVNCGGAHRSWTYSPSKDGGIFVWMRAGAVHKVQRSYNSENIVQPGGHGREIKALAFFSPMRNLQNSCNSLLSKTLATGSEDTDVRLFNYTTDSFRQVAVLRGHTTGLQKLQFSTCGRYLFSCGGMEEFIVWRLYQVPVIGTGAVITAKLAKTEGDDDARIMSFHVISQDSNDFETHQNFLITMAYSNGRAKLFEFRHATHRFPGQFRLLQNVDMGSLCLSQSRLIAIGPVFSMLVGATDGVLRLTSSVNVDNSVESYKVHQSNIASLSVLEVNAQTYLIASGGDDNAVALSLLHYEDRRPLLGTLMVRTAHAAAVTAVSLVQVISSQTEMSCLMVTASNDQRVTIWHCSGYQVNNVYEKEELGPTTASHRMSGCRCAKICEYPTNVADVSSVEIVEHRVGEKDDLMLEVLVAGVGMQVLRLHIQLGYQ